MNYRLPAPLCAFMLYAGHALAQAPAPATPEIHAKVAVLPIQPAGTKVTKEVATLLSDRITAEVAHQRPDVKVIGSSDLQNMVSFEQQKQLLSCSDNSCLAELGNALGVDAIITGSIGDFGSLYIITLNLLDIKRNEPLGRVSDEVDSPDQVVKLVPYLVGTLMQGIPGGQPPPSRPALAKGGGANAGGSGAQAGGGTSGAGESGGAKKDDGGGGSSLPRRLAGVGVAAAGAVLLVAALAAGVISLGVLGYRFFAFTPGFSDSPVKYVGWPAAGLADVLGIVATLVIVAGLVIAVLP